MLEVLSDPKHWKISTNYNEDQDSDEASFEETEEIDQEAEIPWQTTTAPPDNMYEYQRASNLVNMHYAYKSSINKEYANDTSDYGSDEIYPYNYFECKDEAEVFKQAFLRG